MESTMIYAGFWRRLGASAIDYVIVVMIYGMIADIAGFYFGAQAAVFPLLVHFAYFVGFWAWRGQTPGKMAVGVSIVDADGNAIGIGRSVLRYIGYCASFMVLFFVGYLMMVWDGKKQGLHDKIAGTYVVSGEVSRRPGRGRVSSGPALNGKGLAAYMESAGQELETGEGDAGIEGINTSMLTVGVWDRLRFIWDIFILSFPLWSPGNISIVRSGLLVEIFYNPPRSQTENAEGFIGSAVRYASRAMDRIFRHKGINRINVWSIGTVRSGEDHQKRVPKMMKLTMDNTTLSSMAIVGGLSYLAATDAHQYLKICSGRWVEPADFPAWKTGGNYFHWEVVWW